MESSLANWLGVDPGIFHFVVLPLLIFVARISDVSINTLRIIFMLHGRKTLSTALGFFESLIWILAISQIFQNLNSWPTYLAYASGFATGIYVGMVIDEKLAIGRVVVRVITVKPAEKLVEYLTEKNYRYSNVEATSGDGPVNVLFTVVKRENLNQLIQIIKKYNESAFYTVEGVRKVSDDEISDEKGFSFRRFRNPGVRT